jgi:hypothetical protein
MPQKTIELLKNGLESNKAEKFRRGNLISLPGEVELITTGDIHGHRRNFERIVSFSDLANNPHRHVMFQEILHGGPEDAEGRCQSYKLLFDAIGYKLEFPERVHFILGNHDTAFINNSRVMKGGKEMNDAIRLALDHEFKEASEEVKLAMKQFLFSQALAIRCNNRIWLSHSLPSGRFSEKFDHRIMDRELKINDMVKPGSAYLLTWGRNINQESLDATAELFDVDIFILGHQPQKQGWGQKGENLIILASDHNHGCLLPIDLSKTYTVETLIDSIIPLSSIS